MNNYFVLLLSLCMVPVWAKDAPKKVQRTVVDKLLATIYHPEGTVLICQSDLKADLNGQQPSLKDMVTKELIVLDAQKLKIPVTEAEVDRALAQAQDSLHMTRDELKEFFKKQGFTLDQAKKELEKSLLVENVMEARIRSKAHVSQATIEAYHKKNPSELYTLSQAFVPFNGGSKALTRTLTQRAIESGEIVKTASFSDIGQVHGKDFAPEKAYLKELPLGNVVIANESDTGLTLLRITKKVRVPFEERKNEIAAKLGQEKFLKAQQDYFEKLLKEATIRYA